MPTFDAPLATVEDILLAYEQDLPDGARDRVQWFLDYATARLTRLKPQLRSDLAVGQVDPVLVTAALVTAVLRVLRSPGAFQSETAGEFSYTLNTRVATGLLAFTDDELADCSPLAPARWPRSAGSIRMTIPSWRRP